MRSPEVSPFARPTESYTSKVRALLTLVRDLVAVTDNVHQSKGDQDPAEWMPPATAAACRYVAEWMAVKIRWRPTVDSAEKSALTSIVAGCTNVTIPVTQAIWSAS